MASALITYLSELGTDATKLKEFQADPKAALSKSSLSDGEKQAILSGDPAKIRSVAGGSLTGAGDVVVVVLILA